MHERVDRVGLALERNLELGQARLEQTKKIIIIIPIGNAIKAVGNIPKVIPLD